jgi:hypothetical protein
MRERAPKATVEAAIAVPRGARVYSVLVLSGALAAGVVLVLAGARLPAPGPVLLLALAAALCVNRFALFPNEHAATAEAAVLLAAVVGFRDDAPWLGPLLVSLLVGPLDALHWEQRAFVRMAYNAGNRGLATLAAAAAFAVAGDLVTHSTVAWVVSVLVAAGAFTLVDVGLSVGLLRVQGDRLASTFAHLVDIDALTFPIACVGAAVGILAEQVGWWATVAALVPVAFVPELVIARARVRATAVVDLALLLSFCAMLAVIALVSPATSTVTLAVLVGVAMLVGTEFVLTRGALVPPMAATVVAAAVVVGGPRTHLAALLVATVATATTWWCSSSRLGLRFVGALALAGVAGVLAAAAADAVGRSDELGSIAAVTGALAFAVGVIAAAPGRRRRVLALVWSVPLVAAAVAWAESWAVIGVVGGLVWVVAIAVAVAGADAWGVSPWGVRHVLRCSRRTRLVAVGFLGLVALAAAAAGTIANDHATAVGWGWVSAGAGEVVLVMVVCGVRQWRFAPWARTRGLVVSLLASLVLVAAVPRLVGEGIWAGVALVVVTLGTVLAEARPLLRIDVQRVEIP